MESTTEKTELWIVSSEEGFSEALEYLAWVSGYQPVWRFLRPSALHAHLEFRNPRNETPSIRCVLDPRGMEAQEFTHIQRTLGVLPGVEVLISEPAPRTLSELLKYLS